MVPILQRSDCSLVHLCNDSDPVSRADRLSEGHAFDVSVVATVFGSTDTFVASLQKMHIAHGWYSGSLQEVITAWMRVLQMPSSTVNAESEPKQPEESDASNQPDASLSEEDESLPACLALCEVSQAPTASSLKKDLIQKIGKLETHLVLQKLHQKVQRIGSKITRVYTFGGEGVCLKP